jgi:Flp pilus assembly secretin CpaC
MQARRLATCLLCCLVVLTSSGAAFAQTVAPTETQTQPAEQSAQPAPSQPAQDVAAEPDQAAGTAVAAVGTDASGPAPGKRQLREAEDAYLAGAKKLEHDDLNAAESEFQRALKLDPANRNYAIAISVTRQHRLTELVQQATRARQAGDQGKAETLLAEARAIDPQNPIVTEHSLYVGSASAPQPSAAAPGQAAPGKETGNAAPASLVDRTRLIAGAEANGAPMSPALDLAGPIHVTPTKGLTSFHIRGTSADVLRQVAAAYGINAAVDESVEMKTLRFDLENVNYRQAMDALLTMTHTFAVPVDTTGILVARDDALQHQRIEPQLQETIYVPGYTAAELADLVNMAKSVFNLKQIDTHLGNITVRAPEDVLDAFNQTLKDLVDSGGQVMVEVKLYEIDRTRMTNAGATLPTQFSVFNVDEAATQIVNSNQTLVQQAIAQGLVPPGTSNLQLALALIQLGLVKSSLASNLIGVFGGGVFMTGLSGTVATTINLGLNSSDTRTLDDVQQRVGDRETATFREGTRYPIVTSSYTTGLSTAGGLGSLGNQTINGVSVASLLQQYAGGTSATIPQVTYEDLGVTLKATPTIQRTGRVALKLDLKIEALSGSTNDGNPILDNREFLSGLTVGDGDSVMMTSSVSRTETAALTGIPGLSELPGFQMPVEANVEKDDNQLVVVLTTHIVQRPPDLFTGPRIPVRWLATN